MALSPPPVHACPGTSFASCFSPIATSSSQVSRHGFTGAPVHLYLCAERLPFVSKGHLVHTIGSRGKHCHSFGVMVLQASQQGFSAMEGVADTEGVEMSIDSADAPVIQLDSSKQPLLELESKAPPEVQGVPSSVENLSQPSSSAAIESKLVPEEGTSLIDAIPSSPETSLTNQSSDLESIRSSAEGSVNAIVDSSQEATDAAKDLVLSNQSDTAKDAYEALLSGAQTSVEPESAVNPLSQASKNFSNAFVEAKSALENSVRNVQDSFQNSVDNAGNAVKSTYDNATGSFTNFWKTIFGSFERSMTFSESGASKTPITQESVLDTLTSAFRMGTPANNVLKGAVKTVEDTTATALLAAGSLIAEGYTSTKEALPADVQSYLDATEKTLSKITGPLGSGIQQIFTVITDAERAAGIDPQNPAIPVVLVTGGTVALGILYWKSRFGGYSGDLTPTSAFDLLMKDGNIVLVDIRSEDTRETDGVPDLRRQARFKVASVEAIKVQRSFQKLLKNANEAEAMITAAIIRNLKNVELNTKVLIMDGDGSQSKSIARAVKKSGIKMTYRIDGGFKAWEADGLRVKQVRPETALTIIKEETEAILEEIKPTPVGIAAVTLGTLAGIYALIEWEKTLQLLGLICIAQLLYLRFDSYESADDMKADLRGLLRPFALASQGITSIAEQSEPSKLQLATSPSTSAVQDRVLQAAAKHGPVASELDQEQEQEQISEEVSSKGLDVTSIPEEVSSKGLDVTSIPEESPVNLN